MEAKRYDEPPSLQVVAGKAVVAGMALSGAVDLWVLACTSEVSDDVALQTSNILEDRGISLLVVDWRTSGLPPLATLLAANPRITVEWWRADPSGPRESELSAVLESVRTHPDFERESERLRQECSRSLVGLATLRTFCTDWMQQRLESPAESKRSFGQYLTIRAGDVRFVPREAERSKIKTALEAAVAMNRMPHTTQNPAVVCVLGEEGTGKSWLVADWWAHLGAAPIFLFVSGRRARTVGDLGPGHSLRALAALLAEQERRDDAARIEQWYRRLQRWNEYGPSQEPRFVIVLDGLNEHPDLPWADLVADFAKTARDLAGVLITTSRPAFWHDRVRRAVSEDVGLQEIILDGYTDVELHDLLERAGVDPQTLPTRLLQFLRTPRVAAVALSLLDRLALQPSELSHERLLLEYWHARVRERGSLLAHSAEDFSNVLTSHARQWLNRPHAFHQDDWRAHSGLARRDGITQVRNDLTEIAEGRFLVPVPGHPLEYTFRPDVLPFALGLLVVIELEQNMSVHVDWNDDALQECVDAAILGGHPNPATSGHLKTGHHRRAEA